MELTTEDLQQWTKVYKEDKSHVAAFVKLGQEQKYEDFYLTPSGLMARMVGGRQKIIVPKSLRQQSVCNRIGSTHVANCSIYQAMPRIEI